MPIKKQVWILTTISNDGVVSIEGVYDSEEKAIRASEMAKRQTTLFDECVVKSCIINSYFIL